MYETQLTVVGRLVTDVDRRQFADGGVVANFRVVSTQRRYDKAGGTWADGDRLFLDVTCWRRLAENTFASLVKGDNVVVTGRLYTREYEHEGRRRSAITLEAQSVAADLSWCTAALHRAPRRGETVHEMGGDAPRDEPASDERGRGPGVDAPRLVAAAPGGEG